MQLTSTSIRPSEARGARQMLALIGDSENHASMRVHRTLDFQPAGILRSSGWKFNRWLDVVILHRDLGLGDSAAPSEGTP